LNPPENTSRARALWTDALRAGQEALATVRSSAAWPYFLRPGVHLAALGAVFAYLSLLSWRRWPDLIVDFGRELYVPWRIAEGDVLYRDIVHYYGPFGVSVNATLFEIFGPGFDTLFWTNLALLAAFTVALHRLFSRIGDRATALLGSLFFLVTFAFGNFTFIGNYNWVAPYSYDTVYGVYLCFGLLLALGRYLATRRLLWLSVAGALVGVTYLTKPEIFLAALVVAAVGLLAAETKLVGGSSVPSEPDAPTPGEVLRKLGLRFALPLVVVIAVANLWFAVKIGGARGWASVHASWAAIFETRVITQAPTSLNFTGFDDPVGNLGRILGAGVLAVLGLAVLAGGAWFFGTLWATRRRAAIGVAVGTLALAGGLVAALWSDPMVVAKALPCAAGALLVWRAWEYRKASAAERTERGYALLWSALGVGLLAKMILNPRFGHYGFFQAMPATLDLLCFVVADLPRRLGRNQPAGRLAQAVAILVVGALCLSLLGRTQALWRVKNFWVGEGRDSLVTYPPQLTPLGRSLEEVRALIARDFSSAQTLLVLPEGVSLNYLTRKRTAVPLFEFAPPALAFYGQDRLLQQLTDRPPDLVVVLSRDLREFGTPVFGHDEASGRRLLEWIEPRYTVVARGGGDPLKPNEIGLVLLRRK
jgi:hypothetical protein